MDNLSLLTQQLILSQNASKINYCTGGHRPASIPSVYDLALRQRLLSDLANISHLTGMWQTSVVKDSGLLFPQQQFQLPQFHTAFEKDFSPSKTPVLGLSKTCSETSTDSLEKIPKIEEQEEPQQEIQSASKTANSLNSASKKIQKVKKEEEEEDTESSNSQETGKYSPADEEAKKKKNRRPANQIQRLYKCPSTYCDKSYGSETSLKVHIKNKHTLTISHQRLCEIEALLSKIPKKEKPQ